MQENVQQITGIKMKYIITSIFAFSLAILLLGCEAKKEGPASDQPNPEEVKKMEQRFTDFENKYIENARRITEGWFLSQWEAQISGKKEDFERTAAFEKEYNAFVSDKSAFTELKEIKESALVLDPVKQRSLDLLYREYLSKQIDTNLLNQMTELSSQIEQKYNQFRATVDGKKMSDNEVEQTLKTSKDSKKLLKVWTAHKLIGPLVANDIIKLVKMRNQAAKQLGFNNYHAMSLELSGQNPDDVSKLFDELDQLTRPAYKELKAEIDAVLAAQLKITPDQLMPWHYQNRYFQEAPHIYDVDLDVYYKDKNLETLTSEYYKSIGLPIDGMLAASDLYEKPGKNQHAFCTMISKSPRDVRVLCNIKPTSRWMETMLHEYGHAVYFYWLGSDIPWTQQDCAHIFTTEAIAMFFGRLASQPEWMVDMGVIKPEDKEKIAETAKKILRLQMLVFSRWSQVMYRFEKSMYENPDQDLNRLWWQLVGEYQMVKIEGRDMPDWATKTHIASSPCYYHNYLMGELLASQLYSYINENIVKAPKGTEPSFKGNTKVGEYLKKSIFEPANRMYWNDMIEKATGEKLTAKYFTQQFVGKVAAKETDSMPNEVETKILTGTVK